MTVSTDFRQQLLDQFGADFVGAGKVAQNSIPFGTPFPYVWFQRAGDFTERCLDGTPIMRTVDYDLECVSNDIDQAQSLAADVKDALDGFQGLMGDQSVRESTVTDHNDDYVPRNVDEGLHVAALRITLLIM